MDYKTNWKDFLKYDENGRRVRDWPSYVVDTAPGEKNYMYKGELEAMLAAEKAARVAQRAARQAELAASRPESVNSAVTPSNTISTSLPPAPSYRIPDLVRHSRKCLICSHPDRDAIEGEFIRWRSPHKIARDYNVPDRNSIYRHAHATDLFAERRRHVARVLESYLETIDDNPPVDFDPVTRAVRVYAHLNTHGDWFEPLRKVHITTSHLNVPNPTPEPDPNLDPEPEPHLDLNLDADAQADTHERDCPSRASQEKSQAKESRSAEGNTSTKVTASGRSNRHNPKLKFPTNNSKHRRSQNLIVTKMPFLFRRTFA